MEDIVVTMKLDTDQAAKKRQCSCTIGQRDEKTGELIAPCNLHANKDRPDKYITVNMQPELATREMKDAQLGMSAGIKTKMDGAVINSELDDLLSKKLKSINNSKNNAVKIDSLIQLRASVDTKTSDYHATPSRPASKL